MDLFLRNFVALLNVEGYVIDKLCYYPVTKHFAGNLFEFLRSLFVIVSWWIRERERELSLKGSTIFPRQL